MGALFAVASYALWQDGRYAIGQHMRCQDAMRNYADSVRVNAERFNLPPEYLMSLIMLECSGQKTPPARFEPKIYERLKSIYSTHRGSLEHVNYNVISNATDGTLRNLASSWGPFQLMGYKCLPLGILVNDLRGSADGRSVYWACKWIRSEYGKYLDEKQFEKAFRIHNTGRPDGQTHNPNYVGNGMKYVRYFSKRL